MTVNKDNTVTVSQRPSGGRTPGSGTPIRPAPLAQPNRSKGPKVVKQPGRTVTR